MKQALLIIALLILGCISAVGGLVSMATSGGFLPWFLTIGGIVAMVAGVVFFYKTTWDASGLNDHFDDLMDD